MPTIGILTANLFSLLFSTDGGTTFDAALHVKGFTLTFDSKEIAISNMDSGEWEEFLIGRKNWNFSYSGLGRLDTVADKLNTDQIIALFANGTKVKAQFTTNVTGDTYWEGDGFIKGGSIEFQDDSEVTTSIDGRGTGPLAIQTVA